MRVNDYMKQHGHLGVDVLVLDEGQTRRLQLEVLSIADVAVKIFDELGVQWTLSGGSVLGAARHQGFIPWDDDIDFNISREDWDKYKHQISEKLSPEYTLQSPEFDKECLVNGVRIIKRGTVLRELSTPEDEAQGIFVDIFIVENIPNNLVSRNVNGLFSMAFRYVCSCVRMYEQREHLNRIIEGNKEAKKGFSKRIAVGRLCSVIPLRFWLKGYMACNSRCDDSCSRYVSIPTGSKLYFGELIPRDDMFPPSKLEFEGRLWNVPHNYVAYLENLYGDWETIPPVDKREQHLLLELKYDDNVDCRVQPL